MGIYCRIICFVRQLDKANAKALNVIGSTEISRNKRTRAGVITSKKSARVFKRDVKARKIKQICPSPSNFVGSAGNL
jgi:hypothetical protein